MAAGFSSDRASAFAESVRNALVSARQEAVRLRHPYVGTEHLLLGLLRMDDLRARHLCEALDVEPRSLARAQEAVLQPGAKPYAIRDPDELPFTSLAKRAIERMLKEAGEAGQPVVQVEHLLLSLVIDDRGIAGKVCRAAGITASRLRAAARELPQTADSASMIELDDLSDHSISDQIVGQIREKIATGALKPGQRLPAVRRLAEQLDIAPGTVARAYGELERTGVVVTDGARGTRVAELEWMIDTDGSSPEELIHLLRSVVISAYYKGATANQLRSMLEEAMTGIIDDDSEGPS